MFGTADSLAGGEDMLTIMAPERCEESDPEKYSICKCRHIENLTVAFNRACMYNRKESTTVLHMGGFYG